MLTRPREKHTNFPMFKEVLLELHSYCNRDCWFCPRYNDRSGSRKDKDGRPIRERLPTDKIIDILNQLQKLEFTGYITFHHLSEPMLDDRILTIASIAKEKGMKPFLYTNGTLLKDDLQRCRKAAKIFDFMVLGLYDYENTKQLRDEMKFWRGRLKGTRVTFSLHEHCVSRHSMDSSRLHVDINKVMLKARKKSCCETYKKLVIHYNGNIALCCEDFRAEFGLGSIFTKSIKEIWWSRKHIQLCQNLRKIGNRKLYRLCYDCPIIMPRTPIQRLTLKIFRVLRRFIRHKRLIRLYVSRSRK